MPNPPRGTSPYMTEIIEHLTSLERRADLAEHHAKGVRHLQGLRARWLAIMKLIALRHDRFTKESLLTLQKCMELSNSEFCQDLYCLALNGGKRNGYFVEFGACDGKLISNTRLMETEFGWTGILAEPSPYWHEQLRANRDCNIETRCVWHTSGETVSFAEYSNDAYMTQSSVLEHNANAPVSKSYDVETITLLDMLDHYNAPSEIDFLSIDVEGLEFEMIKNFDFSKYLFSFMAIENLHVPKDDLAEMESMINDAGYRKILKKTSGNDNFYVPAHLAEDLPVDL